MDTKQKAQKLLSLFNENKEFNEAQMKNESELSTELRYIVLSSDLDMGYALEYTHDYLKFIVENIEEYRGDDSLENLESDWSGSFDTSMDNLLNWFCSSASHVAYSNKVLEEGESLTVTSQLMIRALKRARLELAGEITLLIMNIKGAE